MQYKTPMEMVTEFHETFGHPVNQEPDLKEIDLRTRLIDEEVDEAYQELVRYSNLLDDTLSYEVEENIIKRDLTKELADILYVVYGTAISLGLPLDEVFARVHESNMSKVGDDGKPIRREDGKILKGPNYKPVDLTDLFETKGH